MPDALAAVLTVCLPLQADEVSEMKWWDSLHRKRATGESDAPAVVPTEH